LFSAAPSQVTNFRQIAARTDSITVAWDPISCLDRNSQIEQYTLSYMLLPFDIPLEAIITDLDATQFTISSLVFASNYSIFLSVQFSTSQSGAPETAIISPSIIASTFSTPGK